MTQIIIVGGVLYGTLSLSHRIALALCHVALQGQTIDRLHGDVFEPWRLTRYPDVPANVIIGVKEIAYDARLNRASWMSLRDEARMREFGVRRFQRTPRSISWPAFHRR